MPEFREAKLTCELMETLISLSAEWEAENSCYGYRKNDVSDLEGRTVFTAEEKGEVIGYLFGLVERSSKASSIMPEGTPCFEVEELYIRPAYRSRGIGRELFRFAEERIPEEAEYIMLSTATKNWKSILHFYLEELDMSFWSARLFKKRIR